MQISATGKIDLASYCALCRLGMFKKADPKKRMIFWTALYILLTLFIVLELLLWGENDTLYTLLVVEACILAVIYFSYFFVPRLQYRSMGKLKDAVNEYVFTDDALHVTTNSGDFHGRSVIGYSMMSTVYETSRYFFLFQTGNQALIVDRATLAGGTALELRQKLSQVLKKKYILCHY